MVSVVRPTQRNFCVWRVSNQFQFPASMDACLSDLAAHRVDVASTLLDTAIDVIRDPKAMDVCRMAALDQGHVVALYKLVRNGLKWSKTGMVPCTDALAATFVHAMVLLLRVAQDVQACVTDLGRPDRAWVYHAFLKKVQAWVAAWPPSALPPLLTVAREVQAWTGSLSSWPNPAWAASFQCPTLIGVTFMFTRPKQEDVAAFERCRTLTATREEVAARLHDALCTAPGWEIALEGALTALVVQHGRKEMTPGVSPPR